MKRIDKRTPDSLRDFFLMAGYAKFADGSCFIKSGDTHVLCTATIEEKVPPFLRNKGKGWVSAEYGMLPRCSPERIDREATKGKQTGRTLEIQRLIGRSLRAIVDTVKLGERQIRIDCDVLQADGGTRTASITGAYVALAQAVQKLLKSKKIVENPIINQVAAISCGIFEGQALLDLNYHEDSRAEVDANFILTADNKIIEIQACAEQQPFDTKQYKQMFDLAVLGTNQLFELQRKALKAS